MSRLPLRFRVVAFALAMAVVLAACGTLVYVLFARDLADSFDRDLQQRAQHVAALVTTRPGSLARLGGVGTTEFAELLDSAGRVVDATSALGTTTLLRTDQVRAAERGQVFADILDAPGLDAPARLLAVPVERGGRSFVLVVGESRANHDETLGSLRNALYIAGPIALVLATALGYLLSGFVRRRAGAGRAESDLQVRIEPITARDLLESVRTRFESRAADAHRKIEIDDPDELRFDGDRARLEQAIGHLVDNALRHGRGTVRLQAIEVHDRVELHVRDEGPGFPPHVLVRGVPCPTVVSSIAKAHGGTVAARNDGHLGGADVWISIPGPGR